MNQNRLERRLGILEFTQAYCLENSISPTVRDIQRACEVSSTSIVHSDLKWLDAMGYIDWVSGTARGIKVLDRDGEPVPNVPRIQVVGYVQAGEPIHYFSLQGAGSSQEFDTVEVPPGLRGRHDDLFGLKVKGTSMVDALVDDGDVVIVRQTPVANDGEMVIAWLKDNEETTLKRFYSEGPRIRLQPANSAFDPIFCSAEDVEIKGRVVHIHRNLI